MDIDHGRAPLYVSLILFARWRDASWHVSFLKVLFFAGSTRRCHLRRQRTQLILSCCNMFVMPRADSRRIYIIWSCNLVTLCCFRIDFCIIVQLVRDVQIWDEKFCCHSTFSKLRAIHPWTRIQFILFNIWKHHLSLVWTFCENHPISMKPVVQSKVNDSRQFTHCGSTCKTHGAYFKWSSDESLDDVSCVLWHMYVAAAWYIWPTCMSRPWDPSHHRNMQDKWITYVSMIAQSTIVFVCVGVGV